MRYIVNYTDKIYGTVIIEAESEDEAEQKVINGDYDWWQKNEVTGDLIVQSIEEYNE